MHNILHCTALQLVVQFEFELQQGTLQLCSLKLLDAGLFGLWEFDFDFDFDFEASLLGKTRQDQPSPAI